MISCECSTGKPIAMAGKTAASADLQASRPRKMQKVVEILADEKTYPGDVPPVARSMLVDAAPFVLGNVEASPHAHVEATAGFIHAALTGIQTQAVANAAAAVARTEEAKVTLDAAEASQNEAIDAVDSMKRKELDAAKVLRKAENAVKQAEADVVTAHSAHALAQKAQKSDAKLVQTAAGVLEYNFSTLADGNSGSDATQLEHIEAVTGFLQQMGTEESLVSSVPAIFKKTVEQRSQWDLLAIEEIKKAIVDHRDKASARLATTSKEEKEAEAEALGESAILWVSGRRVAEAAAHVEEVRSQLPAADAAVTSAFAVAEVHQKTFDRLSGESTRLQAAVEAVQAGLEAFERRHEAPAEDQAEVEAAFAEAAAELGTSPKEAQNVADALMSKPTPCRE